MVTVGKGGQLKFDPETLYASPGDTVEYQFFARVSTFGSQYTVMSNTNKVHDRTTQLFSQPLTSPASLKMAASSQASLPIRHRT